MAYNVINVTILGLLMLLVLYPLYFVVIASISDPSAVGTGQVLFWPSGLNFDGYQRIFEYEMIWVSEFHYLCHHGIVSVRESDDDSGLRFYTKQNAGKKVFPGALYDSNVF